MKVEKIVQDMISWVRNWFEETGGKKAVIGISGGKDSTIAAKVLVEALGKENVIGVMIPCGIQKDISDSIRVCDLLGITAYTVNIQEAYDAISYNVAEAMGEPTVGITHPVFVTNTPARIRMTVLYGVAATYQGGRVVNTCNRSEDYVGYSTKFGDSAGDFSLFANLTVREVLEIGDYLGLPYGLVHKVPSDGMCGKSDEENLGFTYNELDEYLLNGVKPSPEKLTLIENKHKWNLHKLEKMPAYEKGE